MFPSKYLSVFERDRNSRDFTVAEHADPDAFNDAFLLSQVDPDGFEVGISRQQSDYVTAPAELFYSDIVFQSYHYNLAISGLTGLMYC
jgi:hypothetical protein